MSRSCTTFTTAACRPSTAIPCSAVDGRGPLPFPDIHAVKNLAAATLIATRVRGARSCSCRRQWRRTVRRRARAPALRLLDGDVDRRRMGRAPARRRSRPADRARCGTASRPCARARDSAAGEGAVGDLPGLATSLAAAAGIPEDRVRVVPIPVRSRRGSPRSRTPSGRSASRGPSSFSWGEPTTRGRTLRFCSKPLHAARPAAERAAHAHRHASSGDPAAGSRSDRRGAVGRRTAAGRRTLRAAFAPGRLRPRRRRGARRGRARARDPERRARGPRAQVRRRRGSLGLRSGRACGPRRGAAGGPR